MSKETAVVIFSEKTIRRVWHKDEWWFSVVDIEWIDKRLRGIAIRQNLTDEWKERGITAQSDYAILTAEISKATFGMTPTEYKTFKNLPNIVIRE